MALIDVDELMLDPDFVNLITVIRRTPPAGGANVHGENVLTETSLPNVVASVQAVGKDALNRLPEGAQLAAYITVYTNTLLIADVAGGYADVIVWNGNRYQVENVLPWNNFGGGWYMADAKDEKASR